MSTPIALREPAHQVSPRARTMWRLVALLQAVGVLVVVAVVDRFVDRYDVPWWVYLILGVLLTADVLLVPQWLYRFQRWEVSETAVYTQTGWWNLERRIAPISRVQTVDYAEGAIERLFRLASVTVTTASAAGALQINALDREVARSLAAELTVKADAVEGDAT